MSKAEATDTSEHEQQHIEGFEPIKIEAIEKIAKKYHKARDSR